MAKGKHATALFEVIHSAKLKQKTTESGALKTPKWWFKGKGARPENAAPPAATPSAPAQPPVVVARSGAGAAAPSGSPVFGGSVPSEHTAASSPSSSSSPTIIIYDSDPDDCADPIAQPHAPAHRTSFSSSSSSSSSSYSNDPTQRAREVFGALRSATRDDDPPRDRRISFHLTQRTALIGGCGVVAVLGLAYMIGSHLSRGPSAAMGGSIEQLRAGRPAPGVLKVGPGGERILANDETPLQANPTSVAPLPTSPNNAPPVGAGSVGGPQNAAPAPVNGKRIVGMQYVVMQSYPDEADAKAAVDALGKAGIGATAEKGYWPSKPTWFTVIGTKEWDRTKANPEYDKYIAVVTTVGNKFAGQSKFKRFDPMSVRWKDSR